MIKMNLKLKLPKRGEKKRKYWVISHQYLSGIWTADCFDSYEKAEKFYEEKVETAVKYTLCLLVTKWKGFFIQIRGDLKCA